MKEEQIKKNFDGQKVLIFKVIDDNYFHKNLKLFLFSEIIYVNGEKKKIIIIIIMVN